MTLNKDKDSKSKKRSSPRNANNGSIMATRNGNENGETKRKRRATSRENRNDVDSSESSSFYSPEGTLDTSSPLSATQPTSSPSSPPTSPTVLTEANNNSQNRKSDTKQNKKPVGRPKKIVDIKQTVEEEKQSAKENSPITTNTVSPNSAAPTPRAFFFPITTVDPKKICAQRDGPPQSVEIPPIIQAKPYFEQLKSDQTQIKKVQPSESLPLTGHVKVKKEIEIEFESELKTKNHRTNESRNFPFGGPPPSINNPIDFDKFNTEKCSQYIQSEKYDKDSKRFLELFSEELKLKNGWNSFKEKEESKKKSREFQPPGGGPNILPKNELPFSSSRGASDKLSERAKQLRERAHMKLFNELPSPLLTFTYDPKHKIKEELEEYETDEDISEIEKKPSSVLSKLFETDLNTLKDKFKEIHVKPSLTESLSKMLDEKPNPTSRTPNLSSSTTQSTSNPTTVLTPASNTATNDKIEETETQTDASGHTRFVLLPENEICLVEKNTSRSISTETAMMTLKNPLIKSLIIFILMLSSLILSTTHNGNWKESYLFQMNPLTETKTTYPTHNEFDSFRIIHHFTPVREPVSQYFEVDRIFEEEEERLVSSQRNANEFFDFFDLEQDHPMILDFENFGNEETSEETQERPDIFQLGDIFDFHFQISPTYNIVSIAYLLLASLQVGKKSI